MPPRSRLGMPAPGYYTPLRRPCVLVWVAVMIHRVSSRPPTYNLSICLFNRTPAARILFPCLCNYWVIHVAFSRARLKEYDATSELIDSQYHANASPVSCSFSASVLRQKFMTSSPLHTKLHAFGPGNRLELQRQADRLWRPRYALGIGGYSKDGLDRLRGRTQKNAFSLFISSSSIRIGYLFFSAASLERQCDDCQENEL